MDSAPTQVGGWWWFAVPLLAKQGRSSLEEAAGYTNLNGLVIMLVLGVISACAIFVCWISPGGSSWGRLRGKRTIPGPRGFPIIGSLLDMGGLAHRRLAQLAVAYKAMPLMALSLGETRVGIASQPDTAREILHSAGFADRPLKQSADQLHVLTRHWVCFSWEILAKFKTNCSPPFCFRQRGLLNTKNSRVG